METHSSSQTQINSHLEKIRKSWGVFEMLPINNLKILNKANRSAGEGDAV